LDCVHNMYEVHCMLGLKAECLCLLHLLPLKYLRSTGINISWLGSELERFPFLSHCMSFYLSSPQTSSDIGQQMAPLICIACCAGHMYYSTVIFFYARISFLSCSAKRSYSIVLCISLFSENYQQPIF